MKHILLTLLFILSTAASAQIQPRRIAPAAPTTPLWPEVTQLEPQEREVRAVWLCTLGGMDWPGKQYAQTEAKAAAQRQKLCDIFDRLVDAGFNTVLFQVRTRGAVVFNSRYETWDGCITGTPGKAPSYDPLAFAIEEAHKRGLELHAYVVCFPIGSPALIKQLGRAALPNKRPELCQKADGQWIMDPGVPGTATYLADFCRDLVEKYDVDGVHLDYIRYPSDFKGFNDNAAYKKYGGGELKSVWKRKQIDRTVKAIHDAVRSVKPWVKLSCSPVGKYADLPRASSSGWNAFDAVSQDAQLWLKEDWMDWLFPMMYFEGKNFYPFALNWAQERNDHPVMPGLAAYFLSPREGRDWSLGVISREMQFVRQLHMGGLCFFRTQFVLDNYKGIYDFCSEFFQQPALTPASTWLDATPPAAPVVQQERRKGYVLHLEWAPVADETPVVYNIYRYAADGSSELIAHHLRTTSFDYAPAAVQHLTDNIVVRAMDAYGNESE